ncbi:hypothetical protein PC129_g4470 [Phytophthora cactorum]|uniref:DUF4246 domain-containing protein n=1 Tax=Phytophthora cactorum TaxID=29920 RepID=A0A329SJN3_9STRA|nr:hypothetical protein Pcac1_g8268 [Phytophthora cactorum]KAG2833484.1 hypothetical protein PC112_g6462 [Phytophthora cactorum]KAG2835999.1 hypothetical protein PC111_g5185 [Phytophthora cactorum]KAG2862113.1 hypothetical protein PC113_g6596 [Phytophthora cactorum]KAG2903529.1 hypothetical protein PC114_g12224 [Phytophthora cactorum]
MEPRPLLELNVQQAIASILQKDRWWIKWQDQNIREKWLSEVEQQLLLKTFEQSLADWSHGREPIYALRPLLEEPTGPEKQEKLRRWLKDVVTDLKKGGDEEEDEEENDDEDTKVATKKRKTEGAAEELENKRLLALEEEVESQASYPAVKWTFNQLLLHERLKTIPVEEWTDETTTSAVDAARSVNDPSLAPRATEFVLAVRRGVSIKEALPISPGSGILSEDRLLKLKMHCEKIHDELDAVQRYIAKYLELVAKREKMTIDTDLAKGVICPAGIDGVWVSDNIISEELATKFKNGVAELENVPDDEKDWHPHSNNQVLDLVHPSLFCCVFGKTLQVPTALDPSSYNTPTEQMHRLMFTGSEVVERPYGCKTDYQWIPTDFFVGKDGEPGSDGEIGVRTLSYINNLHPEQHSDLYDSIGEIFAKFVPLFERTLSDHKEGLPRSTFRVNMQCHDDCRELPPRPKVPNLTKLPKCSANISLRGKKLQVIVKIAEIILTPEKPKYKGGAWHVEGTSAEKIVGTGIYYVCCENIKESRLSFRAGVEEPPYQQNDDDGVAEVYGLFGNALLVQELGAIEASASRCVVFPNVLQHQVQAFELDDPSRPGSRKILAFFLVDPENEISSTSVIPPQQQEWMNTSRSFQAVDVEKQNIQSMLSSGMNLQEAKQHRLKLMKERSVKEPSEEDRGGNPRYFSLCEH